jgi:hypothetical protein
MQSQLMSPSKTPRKINISKLFLHSVRECLRFIDFKLPGSFPVVPPASGSSKNRVKMQSQLMSPSKTHRRINISKIFLQFIDFKLPGIPFESDCDLLTLSLPDIKNCEKHVWFEVSKLKFFQLPVEFSQLAFHSLISITKSEI